MIVCHKKYRISYCEICGSNDNLTGHHIDPATKGKEQSCDIVTLCWECHCRLNHFVDIGAMKQHTAHFHMWLGVPIPILTRPVGKLKDLAHSLRMSKNDLSAVLRKRMVMRCGNITAEAKSLGLCNKRGKWLPEKVAIWLGVKEL